MPDAPRNRMLIKGGYGVTVDRTLGDVSRGDVLIEGSTTAAVGRNIEAADAYAPDPNLIERFWRFMKRQVLHSKYDLEIADFRAAFDAFFAKISGWKEQLDKLLSPNFHFIGAPRNRIP